MSSYDQSARTAETQQQIAKGADAFLSADERQQVRRLLQFPEEFPKEFKAWLVDYLAVNVPQIPLSQISGFQQTQFYVGTVETGVVSTTSTSYVSLGAGGPIITGAGKGTYLVMHGCAIKSSVAGIEARQSVRANSNTAVTDNGLFADGTQYAACSRMTQLVLPLASNTISVQNKIEGAGTGYWQYRWLYALRTGA